MLLAGGFEAHVALPVEPGVPVPGVHLQDRLEFSAATIDAAFHEGHGDSPPVLRQLGQYQGAGVLIGFGLLLRHPAHRKRLPLTAVFGRTFFPVLSMVLAIGASTRILSERWSYMTNLPGSSEPGRFAHLALKVVVAVHAVKSSRCCSCTS